jgi:phosphosulfolactate phosphohydrolase-like enzyme
LRATADFLVQQKLSQLLLICSGTQEHSAYEDILGAGAMADLLWEHFAKGTISDSARASRQIFLLNCRDLLGAMEHSQNGRRLQTIPELRDDVPFCLRRDVYPLVAKLDGDAIRKL